MFSYKNSGKPTKPESLHKAQSGAKGIKRIFPQGLTGLSLHAIIYSCISVVSAPVEALLFFSI
jgi:hypothetical protein